MAKIHIDYLKDVTWMDGSGCDCAAGNHVDIWRINIDANLLLLDDFSALMTPDEIDRAAKYYFDKDKKRFIVSRGAMRLILSRYLDIPAASIAFEAGYNKKPHIKNSILHYNLSHSGDWLLLAVSNAMIGADLELVNDLYAFKDVLQDNFSRAEIDHINAAGSTARFFKLWTRKEALTKATGKGLDEDLKSIPSLDGSFEVPDNLLLSDSDWQAHSFNLNEQYIACVACDKAADKLRFWDISF